MSESLIDYLSAEGFRFLDTPEGKAVKDVLSQDYPGFETCLRNLTNAAFPDLKYSPENGEAGILDVYKNYSYGYLLQSLDDLSTDEVYHMVYLAHNDRTFPGKFPEDDWSCEDLVNAIYNYQYDYYPELPRFKTTCEHYGPPPRDFYAGQEKLSFPLRYHAKHGFPRS